MGVFLILFFPHPLSLSQRERECCCSLPEGEGLAHYRRLNWGGDGQIGCFSHSFLPSPFVPLPEGEGICLLPLPLGEGLAHYRRLNWCGDGHFGCFSHSFLPSPFVPLPEGEGMLLLPPGGRGVGPLSKVKLVWRRPNWVFFSFFSSLTLCPSPRGRGNVVAPSRREREFVCSLSLWERAGVREIHCSYPRKFVSYQRNPCSRPGKFAGIWQFPTLRGGSRSAATTGGGLVYSFFGGM